MAYDAVGLPWTEAAWQLTESGCRFQTEITRPTRDFFKTDERCLYVVRERELPDGTLALVLAASLQTSSEINL